MTVKTCPRWMDPRISNLPLIIAKMKVVGPAFACREARRTGPRPCQSVLQIVIVYIMLELAYLRYENVIDPYRWKAIYLQAKCPDALEDKHSTLKGPGDWAQSVGNLFQ